MRSGRVARARAAARLWAAVVGDASLTTRQTCALDHCPPRLAGAPSAFNAAAMPREPTPSACMRRLLSRSAFGLGCQSRAWNRRPCADLCAATVPAVTFARGPVPGRTRAAALLLVVVVVAEACGGGQSDSTFAIVGDSVANFIVCDHPDTPRRCSMPETTAAGGLLASAMEGRYSMAVRAQWKADRRDVA